MDRDLLLITLHLTGKKGLVILRNKEPLDQDISHFESILGISLESFISKAEDIKSKLVKKGVRIIYCGDQNFPSSLLKANSFPPLLYCSGNIELLLTKGTGICGSRKASDLGFEYAKLFGIRSVQAGFTVVSGYAKGVDSEAYAGAIEAGGRTIAVLAEGILRYRIKANLPRANTDQFLIISQFPPNQTWNVGAAMERNKVIINLSEGLFVIEAGVNGGTITAGRQALKIKKPLYVINYSQDIGKSEGNKILISEGGKSLKVRGDLTKALAELKSGISQLSSENKQVNLFE